MNATLYIKPNVIGIQFSTPKERDLFWTLLGENRVAAEMFGSKSVRLHPEKASKLFQIPLNGEKIQVIGVEPEKTTPAKVDVPVSVTALKALEPMPAIGSLPPEVTGEVVIGKTHVEVTGVDMKLVAPSLMPIPQVASVSDPKPVGVHHMSKEMREWRARNPKA